MRSRLRSFLPLLVLMSGSAIHGCASGTRRAAAEAANEAPRAANSPKKNNEELALMFQRDQDERKGVASLWTVESDAARRTRAQQILDRGEASSSADYYHAAMVFQHGTQPSDYEQARALALKAIDLDPNNRSAKWLAAAAQDRLLMSLGKPQRYGTQFHWVDGEWAMWKVDPSVTDEERSRWNVPTLSEAANARRL